MFVLTAARYLASRAGEEGLACLAVASTLLGRPRELQELRSVVSGSQRGMTIKQLAEAAAAAQLGARAMQCDPAGLASLATPAVLSWNNGSFVLLVKTNRDGSVRLFDSTIGWRRVRLPELREKLGGEALEIKLVGSVSAGASICDRVMLSACKALGLVTARTGKRTLFYESRWPNHFAVMGLPSPSDSHTTDWSRIERDYSRTLLVGRGVRPVRGRAAQLRDIRAEAARPNGGRTVRVAVVTPYHKEPPDVLRRCHESVRMQTYPCIHILVADGFPSADVESWDARHILLPNAHGDGGCTPRAAGALSAFNSGFDAVAFLDADNWYAPGHVRAAVDASRTNRAALVCADRRIVLPGGEECPFEDRDVAEHRHVDTSCFFMTCEAAYLVAIFAMVGPALSVACDRIVLEAARQKGYSCVWTGERTVYYTSRWGLHYKALGLAPPADEHRTDWQELTRAYAAGGLASRLGPGFAMDHLFRSEHAVTDEPEDAFWSRLVPAP